ncbi:MAG: ParA family protein [Phycisphaerales bacterium]|nr:ParA family protein [Phycisphaerales bacterium]
MPRVPPRISAFINQKGGVGKTTTTVNIGAAIASLGRKVLLIDLDPQAHLSLHLGVDGASIGQTVYDLLLDPEARTEDCIVKVRANLDILPSTVDLAAAEMELANTPDRNNILKRRFDEVRDRYEFVLLDCPPSLGLLTLNALCLAGEVIVPMQAHFLAMQGLSKLLETVKLVSQGLNPSLKVGGVVLCMHETLSTHSKEVVAELDQFFEESVGSGLPWEHAKVLRPAIRRNIKLAEAPSFGQTIFDYAEWCPGAIDYRTLAERFVRDWDRAHGVDSGAALAAEVAESTKNIAAENERATEAAPIAAPIAVGLTEQKPTSAKAPKSERAPKHAPEVSASIPIDAPRSAPHELSSATLSVEPKHVRRGV